VRVAEKLIAFDDAHILPAPDKAARDFLSGQRAVRVGLLRIINWATVACAVVLLSAFRFEWFSVAAWASGRALSWMVRPFGVTLPAVATPNTAVLSHTVGWMAAVLAINWLVRILWAVWNNKAMEDATRGVYAIRAPVGLLLALLVQLFLALVAAQDLSTAFAIAAGAVLCLLIGVTLAQRRHSLPTGLQLATANEASSSATLVFRALLQIAGTGVLIIGVPGALISAAQAAQTYVAEHFGRRASWVLVSAFVLVGVFLAFAAFRAVANWWRGRAKRSHV
jgi:hypothetical protein